jgi:His-Xaa-Ser system protein HxsD
LAQQQPEGIEQVTVGGGRIAITVDRSLYPLDAIYGASYIFIDRCYVLLDAPDSNRVKVELRGREPMEEDALGRLAGEFGNELLSQVWRQQTARTNRLVIEAVTAKAMSGALGAPDLPDLQEGFDADAFDDPLGIAVPWEEKYG